MSRFRRAAWWVPALLLAACGAPVEPTAVTLVVRPAQGPPGTLIEITGLTAAGVASGDVVVRVGETATAALIRDDGRIDAVLPVVLGADGWHQPTDALDVVVEREGLAIGRADGAVRVTALAPAPDAAERLETAWVDILDGIEVLMSAIVVDEAVDAQHLSAQSDALRALVLDGENALARVFDGTAPLLGDGGAEVDPDLTLALLASSGLVAESEATAAGLRPLVEGVATQAGVLCDETEPDRLLACQMQLFVVVREFGRSVVAPTASTFSDRAAVLGVLGVFVNIPGVALASLALSVADLVTNKVVVALLPSKIDAFTLAFEDDDPVVKVGDLLTGTLELTASNEPVDLTSADLLALSFGLFGAAGGLPTDKLPQVQAYVVKLLDYFLGLYAGAFAAYADANPHLNLSTALTSIPKKTWGPTKIEYYHLFDAHSFTAPRLSVYEETPASPMWRAGDDPGDARVNVRTAGNEGALINWSGYAGGAFGENQTRTETLTVCVDGAPELTGVASVSPTVIQAETNASVTFTLPWNDPCANLDRVHATFDLDGHEPFSFQYDVATAPQVSGFGGEGGTGVLTETLWVWCSERGRQQVNATFYLLDAFSEPSEERSGFVLVDYGACP